MITSNPQFSAQQRADFLESFLQGVNGYKPVFDFCVILDYCHPQHPGTTVQRPEQPNHSAIHDLLES